MMTMLKNKTGKVAQHYYLHLGLHKTATTALQSFMQQNSAILLGHDVRYVQLQRMRAELTPLFCSSDTGRRRKLFDLLETLPNGKILLSDENILGSPSDIVNGALYPFAKNRVETFCEEAGARPVTLFLTLREPGAFLTSLYCEYVRHNEFITFGEYVAPFDVEGFSYGKIFRWLKRMPKNARVVILPFESSLGDGVGGIARRIIEEVAGKDSRVDFDLFPKAKSRSSYSQEEIDLAATIAGKAGGKMAQVFLNALDARDRRFGSLKFSPIDAGLVEELAARYREELAEFQANLSS
jgi:hypothetical protein